MKGKVAVFSLLMLAFNYAFSAEIKNSSNTSSNHKVPIEKISKRPRQLLPEEGDVNLTCEYFRGSLSFRFAESEGNACVTVTLPDGALVKSATMITDK